MASSSTPITEDDVMAKRLWNKFKYERIQALYTPFVVSLAAGTLERDDFLHCIAQDVHILRAFAQAYEKAEQCADDNDAKVEICKLWKSIPQKLKLHDFFIQTLGFDLHKESTPKAATVKYTDFLLATASGKVDGVKAPDKLATTPFEKSKLAAYIIGAMTPRMRLYAFLGKELLALPDPSKGIHPNQKWIESFFSDTFQAEAMQTEELLEKLSVSLTGEELDIIEKLYRQAMKLEVEFFLAQPLVKNTIVPLCKGRNPAEPRRLLFSAFDLTCTVLDSSSILAELAILTASKSDQTHVRSRWEEHSKRYTEEYELCIESILVGDKVEKFDYEGLRKAIQHISDFEKKSDMRATGFEVLKGLSVEDIQRAGESMVFQDGCMDFFHSFIQNENLNTNIHVISYCWSGDLIKSAFSSGGLDSVNVHANELMYENSISTGEIIWKVVSPIDKVEAFSSILNDQQNVTLYIGATVGDLLCLLQAQIGIVIGSSSSLRRLGSHFGVSFAPLFPSVIEEQHWIFHEKSLLEDRKGRKFLYTVSSWAEIHAFLLGF
ncbi:hypothetical protein BUALT_Bualt15G0049500 [Buddleja alternifolia]|uniref:Thiaminase-2/PQQC domain-containing protein n=1 Tax=Buddleja alternifolia TaxID=168488 RepID=A0AAV6WLS4_9LAMI|nr:hypothetical protein BUALT_Bualt15G0049500 [Buddleja alternifolia]